MKKTKPYETKRELHRDLGKLLKEIGRIESRIGAIGSFKGSEVYFGHVASAYSVIENSHGVLGDHVADERCVHGHPPNSLAGRMHSKCVRESDV